MALFFFRECNSVFTSTLTISSMRDRDTKQYDQYAFLVTTVAVLCIPLVLKMLLTRSIGGVCSKRGAKLFTRESLGHTTIGVTAGLLASPIGSGTSAVRSAAAALGVNGYPLYNLLKRGSKEAAFGDSSYFTNLFDVCIGFVLGSVVGAALSNATSNSNGGARFRMDERVVVASYALSGLVSATAVLLTLRSRGVACSSS